MEQKQEQKTLFGQWTLAVLQDQGVVGRLSRNYIGTPQTPDNVDAVVESTKEVATTTGYIFGYGAYYLVSGTLNSVVDLAFWTKSVVWRRTNTDHDPNDVELEVIEGEDEFVLVGNSEVNDMNNVL